MGNWEIGKREMGIKMNEEEKRMYVDVMVLF